MTSATRIRRRLGDVARAAQPHARSVAGVFLRAPLFRQALNAVEERAGDVTVYSRRDVSISDLADFALHSTSIDRPFDWRSRFGRRSYLVPVDAAFPHPAPHNDPWGPATYWHRAQNRKLRHVYELVLEREPAGAFLDVGANWGMHTYPFAAHDYRCVCFEPQSACCRFIERVCGLNRFADLDVVQCVVGADARADVPFFESDVEVFSSMDEQHVARFQRPFTRRAVEMVTLDAVCDARALSPTLVKIDAEGSEWEVVRGALRMLRECRPTLVVEVSSGADAQRAMWDALSGLDYRGYWIAPATARSGPLVPVGGVDEFLKSGASARDDEERDFLFVHTRHARLVA